jgi:hypothetical protein
MSMVHVHVHGACPCPCFHSFMFLSMFMPCIIGVCACATGCACSRVHINAGMPGCPASNQSGTGMEKLTMPGQVRYRTKPRQSSLFLVRYRTKIIDAGMPMPALVSWMPMPSYGNKELLFTSSSILTPPPTQRSDHGGVRCLLLIG